jgi:hypothetical protein
LSFSPCLAKVDLKPFSPGLRRGRLRTQDRSQFSKTRKRKPFEPTHLELPPIGSIYVPLDEDCQTHGNIPYVVRPERPIIDNGLLLIVPAPLHGRAGPLVEQAHLA